MSCVESKGAGENSGMNHWNAVTRPAVHVPFFFEIWSKVVFVFKLRPTERLYKTEDSPGLARRVRTRHARCSCLNFVDGAGAYALAAVCF